MSVCRICLADSADHDITELKINGKTNSYKDVLLFSLDIQVHEDDNISTKLCLKCCRCILFLHEFKCKAQRNDIYWKSLQADSKDDKDVICVNYIKEEDSLDNFVSVNPDSESDFVDGVSIKIEGIEGTTTLESDDELLSVFKALKSAEQSEDTKENDPLKGKFKKRVRKRKPTQPVSRVCEECGKSVRNLKLHMYLHIPKQERQRLQCTLCDKTFATQSARNKHNKVKHLGIKKKCHICNKEVISLWAHLKRHNPSTLPFPCPVCKKRFITPSVLNAHMGLHTAVRSFQCDKCEKTFNTKMVMLQHRRQVHDKERSHLCQICSKSFFKKYHLQVHLRSHTKERPYECDVCRKYFSSSTTLKNHKELHENKIVQCTLCDMTFRSPKYLKVHMISHTKVKSHACKYCGVRFGRSDHRKRHERTAHERHLGLTPS